MVVLPIEQPTSSRSNVSRDLSIILVSMRPRGSQPSPLETRRARGYWGSTVDRTHYWTKLPDKI